MKEKRERLTMCNITHKRVDLLFPFSGEWLWDADEARILEIEWPRIKTQGQDIPVE